MKTVIFYHIPKTAGSSFYSAAHRNFSKKELYFIDSTQGGHEKSIREFKELSSLKREKIGFLLGHNTWGLHVFFTRPVTYITFLRNPLDRILSEYYHLQRKEAHLPERKAFKESGSTLATYLKEGDLYFGRNKYIKMLLNIQEKNYEVTEADLKKAIQLLREHFSCVCITEKFNESVILLNETLGWNIQSYDRVNVADNYDKKKYVTEEVNRLYEELYRYDILLYRHFLEVFNKRMESVAGLTEKMTFLEKGIVHTSANTFQLKSTLTSRIFAKIKSLFR